MLNSTALNVSSNMFAEVVCGYSAFKGSAMCLVKVLLLISAILPAQSEMHSLYYMYSVISKSLMSGEMFEFYTSVELSDIQMSLCHSVNKADFMTQLCEETERLINESDDLHYKQQWLQINLKTLMMTMEHKRKNSTRDTDLHVLQWRHGCAVERHSYGSVMFLQGTDEYAYDGQTLTFDLSMHWKPLVLDHDIIWDRESVSSLERKCVETLTSFTDLQLEGKFIMESRPDVHTLVKASGSSVKQLVCLATGFYPKHVQMEIRHNQTPLPDEQLNSDGIRPNADGSFQLMKSLKILPSEASQYQCVVKHQTDESEYPSVDRTDTVMEEASESIWNDKTESNLVLAQWHAQTDFVVTILVVFSIIIIIIFIIALTFYQLRKYGEPSKEQDTLKTPSLLQLSALHKTQMEPELLEEIRAEKCAGLAAALNDDTGDGNPTDPCMEEEHTEEVHDTQSLCDTEATPAAARGAMGSKIISLPNFALEREDADQNTFTQNVLLLPLPRRWRSKDISLPNLV